MKPHLPDEFFRRRPDETDETGAQAEAADDQPASRGEVAPAAPERVQHAHRPVLVPVRMAAVIIFCCLLAGFLFGRQLLSDGRGQGVVPGPSREAATPTPSASLDADPGHSEAPTRILTAQSAVGSCPGGDAQALIDGRDSTAWICDGEAIGETVRFTFAEPKGIVGLRVMGGQVNVDELGRHVTAIRWRFSDGSWFEQGLADVDDSAQEIDFPQVWADSVTLEILAVGAQRDDVPDQTALSAVEFLTRG